ncbi:MAG: tRNA epoxyqueuosine(34) reductase QueG [Legionellales bacterium]|nr:tRNA epoxyqueuosine(34) reductase QueG [Legionellales bacterium]
MYTNLPLEVDKPFIKNHCGSCNACIDICPTNAIVGDMEIDARRCISYLTIELRGSIPIEFRKLIGNRVYGCDDCQLICPWNKFSKNSEEDDFRIRNGLDSADLVELFSWTEKDFLKRTEGSAIRRIGYQCWLRNIAIGLGNAPKTKKVIDALKARQVNSSLLVNEHIEWALKQHE